MLSEQARITQAKMTVAESLTQDAPLQPIEANTKEPASIVDDSSAAQKRKASSPGPNGRDERSASPKRRRRQSESGSARNGGRAATPPSADRRQSASIEEKRRGKRLFGGLLNTLSQTSKTSSQKKRHDAERRQQEKLSLRETEGAANREANLAKLKATRQRAQIRWEERVLRTKHDHLLDTARFLCTESEPKIYYLPWEPTARQETLIKDQIQAAEDLVEKETREFKQRKVQRLTDLGVPLSKSDSESSSAPAPESAPKSGHEPQAAHADQTRELPESTLSKADKDVAPDLPDKRENNGETIDGDVANSADKIGQQQDRENDEAEDVMVEGDEDTVIY